MFESVAKLDFVKDAFSFRSFKSRCIEMLSHGYERWSCTASSKLSSTNHCLTRSTVETLMFRVEAIA